MTQEDTMTKLERRNLLTQLDGKWHPAHFLADTHYPQDQGKRHACWYERNGALHVDVYAETGRAKFRPCPAVPGAVVLDRQSGEYGLAFWAGNDNGGLRIKGFAHIGSDAYDPARHVTMLLPRQPAPAEQPAPEASMAQRINDLVDFNIGVDIDDLDYKERAMLFARAIRAAVAHPHDPFAAILAALEAQR